MTKRIITSDFHVVINFQENVGPKEKNPGWMKSLVNQGSDNRDSSPGCSKVDSTIQGCQK